MSDPEGDIFTFYFVAEALGKTVREIMSEMTWGELQGWCHYFAEKGVREAQRIKRTEKSLPRR